jgi:hypothetical protein
VILRNSGGFKKNNIPVEAKDKHALGYDPWYNSSNYATCCMCRSVGLDEARKGTDELQGR